MTVRMGRPLSLLLLCAALLAAGCGDDGPEGTPVAASPEPAATTAPEPTASADKPRSEDEDPQSATTREPLDPDQDDPVDDDEVVVEEDGASGQGSTGSRTAGRKPARKKKRSAAKKERSKPEEVKVVRGDDIPKDAEVAIEAAKETIRAIIRLSNEANPKLCTDLFTLNHVENSTGKKGDAAVAQCRKDVENSKIKVKLDGIDGVRILADGRALVTYRSSIATVSRRQTVVLVEDDDRYKLDGSA